jgi:hypothetical protein
MSTGTIHCGTGKPAPSALVKKMVKVRVAQNERQTRKPGSLRATPSQFETSCAI